MAKPAYRTTVVGSWQDRCGGLGWRARQRMLETGAATPGHLGDGHAAMAAMTARRLVVASLAVAVIASVAIFLVARSCD